MITPTMYTSVIIPVYNDPVGIRNTLQSLTNQTYSTSAYEIIVIDNGSTDGTRTVIQEFSNEFCYISLVIEAELQGSYAARNTGIQASSGEILVFIDADMTVDDNWLSKLNSKMEQNDIYYLACNVEQYIPDGKETRIALYDRVTGFPVERYVKDQQYSPTCCLCVRHSIFDKIGFFDPRLRSGGDLEFGNRAAAVGINLHFAPEITVYHPTRTTLRSLLSKELRVGGGICRKQRYYPTRYGSPGIPPRPSGVKSPDKENINIANADQFSMKFLEYLTMATRGIGYYTEFASGTLDRWRS